MGPYSGNKKEQQGSGWSSSTHQSQSEAAQAKVLGILSSTGESLVPRRIGPAGT